MSAVALRDVGFRYPGGGRDAISGIDLTVAAGELVWVFGVLGSGCSTLLMTVAGLVPRYTGGSVRGRVTVLGVDPRSGEGRRRLAGEIAYVTETPSLQLSGIASTVWEEVAFTPANLGWPVERIREAVDAALVQFEIVPLGPRDPRELSAGELQRVVLASMLALDPSLWLLDEPATALDARGRALLVSVLERCAARGAAVIVASEDADLFAPLVGRVLWLDGGGVVADGPPAEILAGERIWSGPGGTSVALLARAAGRELASPRFGAPYPLTVTEAVRRWGG